MSENKKSILLIIGIIIGSIILTGVFVFVTLSIKKNKIEKAVTAKNEMVADSDSDLEDSEDHENEKNGSDDNEVTDNGSSSGYVSQYDHSNLLDISDHIDIVDIPKNYDISQYTIDYMPQYDYIDELDGYVIYWRNDGLFDMSISVRTENAEQGRIIVREIVGTNGTINVEYIDGVFNYASYEVYDDKWNALFIAIYDIDGNLVNVQIITTRYYEWGTCQQTELYLKDGSMQYNYYHSDYEGNLLEETHQKH